MYQYCNTDLNTSHCTMSHFIPIVFQLHCRLNRLLQANLNSNGKLLCPQIQTDLKTKQNNSMSISLAFNSKVLENTPHLGFQHT